MAVCWDPHSPLEFLFKAESLVRNEMRRLFHEEKFLVYLSEVERRGKTWGCQQSALAGLFFSGTIRQGEVAYLLLQHLLQLSCMHTGFIVWLDPAEPFLPYQWIRWVGAGLQAP